MTHNDEFQTTTIDLLRHGACEGGEIFRGSTDVALSEMGWAQMRQSVAPHGGWDHIVSSSLQRCQRFAQWLSETREVPLSVDARLREIHFGRWEGQPQSQVMAEDGVWLRGFWSDPVNHSPPEGELVVAFQARISEALNAIVQAHQGKHILLVTHGAVIRMMLCEWLAIPLTSLGRLAVPYASLSRLCIFTQANEQPWVQLQWHGQTGAA